MIIVPNWTLVTGGHSVSSPQSDLEGTKRFMWIAAVSRANQKTVSLRSAAAPASSTNLPCQLAAP